MARLSAGPPRDAPYLPEDQRHQQRCDHRDAHSGGNAVQTACRCLGGIPPSASSDQIARLHQVDEREMTKKMLIMRTQEFGKPKCEAQCLSPKLVSDDEIIDIEDQLGEQSSPRDGNPIPKNGVQPSR